LDAGKINFYFTLNSHVILNPFLHIPKISYSLFLLLLFSLHTWAQQKPFPQPGKTTERNLATAVCGTDLLLSNLRKQYKYREKEALMNRQIQTEMNSNRVTDTGGYTLPVVFHIVNADPSLVTDLMITQALKDLNDAFAKKGTYAGSKGANTKIQFCIARKDPDGGITNGITRTKHFFAANHNTIIEEQRLKKLIQWDASRYINIWYIQNINAEIQAQFSCGQWLRLNEGGYATLPPNAGEVDGIVVTGFGSLLAHEMGHYLGLYHTFQGGCSNNNCETDGDMVCDTPPDNSVSDAPSCNNPSNTCTTDTLSNHSNGFFPTDVPDMISNFMDYGNEGCHNAFTEGQAARMRAVIATQRNGLLQPECNPPCNDNVQANFTRDNAYPLPGDNISFTVTSASAANYQWLIDNVVTGTGKTFSHVFTVPGRYKVSLKAYNNPGCVAIYTDYVTVTCGVTARFYTDKQAIASKTGIQLDSISFVNTSENASAYYWLLSNDAGLTEQVISTQKDLNYVFTTPGNYTARLVATNGACSDTTGYFPISVADPTADGVIYFSNVSCYQKTKVLVSFYVCNYGYAPVPVNTPVSFYDADPSSANAHKLGSTFFLPDELLGKCCSSAYSLVLDIKKTGLNQIYAVLADSGNVIPVQLPNTGLTETDYKNNIASSSSFSFTVTAQPSDATLEPGDTLTIAAISYPDQATYTWQPPYNFLCKTCSVTQLVADTTDTKMLIAKSEYGCFDTAYIKINVPPADDYTITIDSLQCASNNRMHVDFTLSNSFKRGVLPKGLPVAFYSSDPNAAAASLLSTYVLADTVHAKTGSFSAFINGITPGTTLYAVVNDSGTTIPLQLPNTEWLEKNYTNNTASVLYPGETVLLQPADTTVYKNQSVTLQINSTVFDAASTHWFNNSGYQLSCTDCLSPVVTVTNSSVVTMQTANKYGCLIPGSANVKIFQPDMTVEILKTSCYTNNTTQVTFKICMGNNYDSVYAGIPVSFYDSTPGAGRLLNSVFYTPAQLPDSCATYTHRITTGSSHTITAVVNDKGNGATIPDKAFDETDTSNNTYSASITPFIVTVIPADTSVPRLTALPLNPVVISGNMVSYAWLPSSSLSCTTCLVPIATPSYTSRYTFISQNEFFCKDTSYALVKTFTGGLVNMPGAFTPNSDGRNDVYYVLAGSTATTVEDFSIYDRWGKRLFHVQNVPPNDPSFGWTGNINGMPAPPGTYVYFVKMAFSNAASQLFKGTVVLMR